MQEIEVKLSVRDADEARARLGRAGAVARTPRQFEDNRLYDDAARGLKGRREVLRLRSIGDANVVTFKGSAVLGSVNQFDITAANLPAGASSGWAQFDFTTSLTGAVTAHTLVASSAVPAGPLTFNGLPAIGFAVQTFVNGTLTSGGTSIQSNYGGNFVHKTTRLVN